MLSTKTWFGTFILEYLRAVDTFVEILTFLNTSDLITTPSHSNEGDKLCYAALHYQLVAQFSTVGMSVLLRSSADLNTAVGSSAYVDKLLFYGEGRKSLGVLEQLMSIARVFTTFRGISGHFILPGNTVSYSW